MDDRTKTTIEHLYQLNRIDNRLIGCLEEQLKQVTKLYKDEVLVNDKLLDMVVSKPKEEIVYKDSPRLVLEIEQLRDNLILANQRIFEMQNSYERVS